MSRTTTLSVRQLRADLNGQVIAPDDPAYDQARTVFYGGYDRRPAVIVRPADATDVGRVVSLARGTGLELAVRSGGHSVAGTASVTGESCSTWRTCGRWTSTSNGARHGSSPA